MRTALVVLAVVSLPALATAQTPPNVAVSGVITDATGAVVPDVMIEARFGGLASTARSAPDGRYAVVVRAGDVEVTFSKIGFESHIVRVKTLGEEHTLNVTLRVGAIVESTVVTATRAPESTTRLTGSVSTFDEEAIRARGSRSLSEVLQQTPGLQIEATGREGALTSLFSRGGESDYNLVLIDGVRVTLPGGRFDFGRVDANQIERVEVVRGAQSALYGSEAIGAVVQVFTRSASVDAPPRVFGSLDGGSFGTVRGSAGVSSGFAGRGNILVGTSYRGTDGAFSDRLTEQDRFDQMSFDVSGGARVGPGTLVRASVRYANSRGRSVGQLAYGIYDRGTFYNTRDVSSDVRLEQTVTSRYRHEASFGVFDYNNLTGDRIADAPWSFYGILEGTVGAIFPDSPRLVRQITKTEFDALRASGTIPSGQFLASRASIADFPSSSAMDAERRSFHYQGEWSWSLASSLAAGYDYDAEDDPNTAIVKRHNHAVFLQQQFRPGGRWFANVGVRLDDNSRYGTEWSPKASFGGFLMPFRHGAVSSVKLQGNIGHGIKNPVFAELFSAFVDGNPNLNPERATTMDGGAEVTLADQRIAVVAMYFRNRYEDQVAFRSSGPGLDGIPDYINIEGSKADGAEFEFRLQRPMAGITASAFYTYVDTAVTTTVSTSQQFQPGQPLLRRPRHSGNIFASWMRGPVTINGGVRLVGERHDAAFLSLTTVATPTAPARAVDITVNPGYAVLQLNGEYRVNDAVAVYLRLDNVADEVYESALGFSGLPRSAAAGIRFNLAGRK
jgi:outer membrane cobalamin receptor